MSVAHAQFKFKDHFDNEKNPQMSPMLLSYLDKIIELTKENNFKLILVNAPKYKYYREMVPQIVLTDFNKIVKQITSSNTNVVFYDFSSALNDSTLFYDTDHLNTNGAEKFSIKIDSCLKSLDKK